MEKTILKSVLTAASCAFLLLTASFTHAAEKITAQELKAMLERKENVVLIDVRTPEEHRETHIPGSFLMPLDTLESVQSLPEGSRHIIYCRSGKRSLRAIEILSAKGFKGLINLEGGIIAWTKAGGPVVSGKGR